MRRLLIVLCLLFLVPQSVFAQSETTNGCREIMDDEIRDKVEVYKKDEADLVESYTIDFISSFWNMPGINSLSNLIFGNPYCVWNGDNSELVMGLFTPEFKQKIIDPILKLMIGSFSLFLILSMMVSTLKVGFSFVSRSGKEEFKNDIIMWFVVTLFLSTYWFLVHNFIPLNTRFIETLRNFLESFGINIHTSSMVASQGDLAFSDILLIFAEWILMLIMNFIYIARIVIITILLMLGGFAGISLLYRSTRPYFSLWLQELIGAIFMQSIHALLFTIFLMLSSMTTGDIKAIYKLGLLMMFLPISSIVLSWTKFTSAGMSYQMGLTGVKTIAATVFVAKRINNITKQNMLKQRANVINGTGVGKTKISALAEGNNSSSWMRTKNFLSKTGAIVGGTAGSVLGPAGVVLGASVGSKITSGISQGARNTAFSSLNTIKTLKEAKNKGFRNVMSNIQDRRNFMGNMGESLGSAVGLGTAGRNTGHSLSGVSRQRLMNSNELGGFGGVSLHDLNARYPEAKVNWIQTNSGSGFYMDNGSGKMKAISPLGPADPNLRNGEIRKVDYQFGGNPFAMQNGTYNLENRIDKSMSPLQRTSHAYVQDNSGNKFKDTRFNAESITPESYFESGMSGVDTRTMGDRVADKLHSISNKKQPRHRGFA